MARPALAVARGVEQPVYNFSKCFGRSIAHKGLHFFRSGRQAREVERGPANQRHAVGWRRRPEVLLFQLRQNERVDFILYPRAILRLRYGGLDYFLECPPAALLRSELLGCVGGGEQ